MADGRSHFASVLWFVFENFAIKLEDFYKSLNTFFGLCHVQNFVVDKLSKPRVVKCSCVSFVPLCGLTNKSFFFFTNLSSVLQGKFIVQLPRWYT